MKISTVIILIFSFSLLSRILTSMGLPTVINFIHFFLIPVLFCIAKPWESPELKHLITALAVLISTIIISGVMNNCGYLNIILEILLFCEPFLLLLAILSSKWSTNGLTIFRQTLFLLCFVNIGLAFFQFVVLGYNGDEIKGIFLGMGAGHHVCGAISMLFGIYWFIRNQHLSLINRSFVFLLSVLVVFVSDSKQVLAVNLTTFGIIIFVSHFRIAKLMKNIVLFFIAAGGTYLIGKTIYPPLLTWASPKKLLPALEQKFSVIHIITNSYDSFICWMLGLGPGHTTSRLALLMNEYGNWLYSLGATTSPLTNYIIYKNQSHWMSNSVTGSSFFSLTFSWAGIWGDIGIIGAASYIYCWLYIIKEYCPTPFDRYSIFCVLVYGVAFSWLEEPGFMLFVISLLGLSWQDHKCEEGCKTGNAQLSADLEPARNAYPFSP